MAAKVIKAAVRRIVSVAPRDQLPSENVLMWVKEQLSNYGPMMADTLWGPRHFVRFCGARTDGL
jgi:hypothetical protein